MGYKMQLNGVDNAKLVFDNVRVPRENLLNKFSDVDEAGVFSSPIKGGRARLVHIAASANQLPPCYKVAVEVFISISLGIEPYLMSFIEILSEREQLWKTCEELLANRLTPLHLHY